MDFFADLMPFHCLAYYQQLLIIIVHASFSWEPDPAEVDPTKGSNNRRKIDILAMIVSLIGSKDQLVNEYRVMLAERLLNKVDYDFDSEIRTLELLKVCDMSSIDTCPLCYLCSEILKVNRDVFCCLILDFNLFFL